MRLHDSPGERSLLVAGQRFTGGVVPNVARIYDCLLGGKDGHAEDRLTAVRLMSAVPDAAVAARDNQQFLVRAVEYLVREAGIGQFIDIGVGLPSRASVHAVAHRVAPSTRIAVVDNDPVVITHANAFAGSHQQVAVIDGDLRDPQGILGNAGLRELISLDEPVAIVLAAVLHHIRDRDNPAGIVGRLVSAVAPGSHLVISHATSDHLSSETTAYIRELYTHASAPCVTRTRDDIAGFFGGLELIPPGLVSPGSWRPVRPEDQPRRTLLYAGVAVKR